MNIDVESIRLSIMNQTARNEGPTCQMKIIMNIEQEPFHLEPSSL